MDFSRKTRGREFFLSPWARGVKPKAELCQRGGQLKKRGGDICTGEGGRYPFISFLRGEGLRTMWVLMAGPRGIACRRKQNTKLIASIRGAGSQGRTMRVVGKLGNNKTKFLRRTTGEKTHYRWGGAGARSAAFFFSRNNTERPGGALERARRNCQNRERPGRAGGGGGPLGGTRARAGAGGGGGTPGVIRCFLEKGESGGGTGGPRAGHHGVDMDGSSMIIMTF